MSSLGVDWRTGKWLSGWPHVLQSIEVILTTHIGDRIAREWFGFPGARLLGELANEQTIVKFFQTIAMALTIRQLNGLPAEPRFRLTKIVPLEITRDGHLRVRLDGTYYPRGHLGDFSPEDSRLQSFWVEQGQSGISVSGSAP